MTDNGEAQSMRDSTCANDTVGGGRPVRTFGVARRNAWHKTTTYEVKCRHLGKSGSPTAVTRDGCCTRLLSWPRSWTDLGKSRSSRDCARQPLFMDRSARDRGVHSIRGRNAPPALGPRSALQACATAQTIDASPDRVSRGAHAPARLRPRPRTRVPPPCVPKLASGVSQLPRRRGLHRRNRAPAATRKSAATGDRDPVREAPCVTRARRTARLPGSRRRRRTVGTRDVRDRASLPGERTFPYEISGFVGLKLRRFLLV